MSPPAQTKTAKKRRASNRQENLRANAAKQILKSLITLDPYEAELADNPQNEGIWNEHREAEKSSSSSTANNKSTTNEGAERQNGEQDDAVEPTTQEQKQAEADLDRRLKEEAEFAAAEHERDMKLPEEYRKFRPRGYDFKVPPKDRPVRVYADGVFDLFHMGHMKQLEQAKKSLPNVEMVVGVPNDQLTHKYKGLTVLSDEQRYESLRHCRWVDEVIPDAPWEVNQEFLDKHHIDYVAHDDAPYAGPDGQDDVYKFVKERGQFMVTQRTDGISTSDIITKIVKDYDLYLMRNFKRGVSRKELNVSWIKKNELDIKRHVNEFRESWRNNVENTTKDIYSDLVGYTMNAPRNSVIGRARDWVSKHTSRNPSPQRSPQRSESESLDGSENSEGEIDEEEEEEEKSLSEARRKRQKVEAPES